MRGHGQEGEVHSSSRTCSGFTEVVAVLAGMQVQLLAAVGIPRWPLQHGNVDLEEARW